MGFIQNRYTIKIIYHLLCKFIGAITKYLIPKYSKTICYMSILSCFTSIRAESWHLKINAGNSLISFVKMLDLLNNEALKGRFCWSILASIYKKNS